MERLNVSGLLPSAEGVDWEKRDADIAAERQAEADREERARLIELRRDLAERGAPVKDLERVIAGDLFDTAALLAVGEAERRGMTLIVLSGPPGLGKTTAATWWLVQRRTQPVVRVWAPSFVKAFRLARFSRYEDAVMRPLERASALVLDDLGVEYDDTSGAFRSLLDGLLDARYEAQLPTLITTNLTKVEFKKRYHERIADRIREAGDFIAIRGPSMRLKGPARG